MNTITKKIEELDYAIHYINKELKIIFNPNSNVFKYFNVRNQIIDFKHFPSIFELDKMEKEIFDTMIHNWYVLIAEYNWTSNCMHLIQFAAEYDIDFQNDIYQIPRSNKETTLVYLKINEAKKISSNREKVNKIINNILHKNDK